MEMLKMRHIETRQNTETRATSNGKFSLAVLIACITLVAITSPAIAEEPYSVAWISQLGTSGSDYSYAVAVDSNGNAYISGKTDGSLDGNSAGLTDAFLAKYDSSGASVWIRQLGTSTHDVSESVAVDSAGNTYISGWTWGSLDGNNAGLTDAFLAKYDSSGTWQWTRQLGTASNDYSKSVAIDSNDNVYISGHTEGSLDGNSAGSADAFLAKYNSSGVWQWTRQLGTSEWDASRSVAVDSNGNAYISGYTEGSLDGNNVGLDDAFLAKYDSSGVWLWTRQLGTEWDDKSYSVAVDSADNAYISGLTNGSLDGNNVGFQ
ncbi:hypothetical protein LCGC14_2782830, partial [marine sediment metagenome]